MSDAFGTEDREALFARLRTAEYEPSATGGENKPESEGESAAASGTESSDGLEPIAALAPPVGQPFKPAIVDYFAVPAVVVPLSFPFKIDGLRVKYIKLRPPRLDYFRAQAHGQISRSEMIAEMAGVSVSVINAMRWPDAERVLAIAGDMSPDLSGA